MKFEYTFEQAVARMEEITTLLSSGTATLNSSLELFQEASELIVYCEELLKNAKMTVEEASIHFSEGNDEQL